MKKDIIQLENEISNAFNYLPYYMCLFSLYCPYNEKNKVGSCVSAKCNFLGANIQKNEV